MNRNARMRRWPSIAAAVGALLLALVGTAIAKSGPATTSVSITKVSKKANKALRKASRAIRIARSTSKQSGPQGATGPRGATGPQGPAGVSGLVIVEAETTEDTTNEKFEEAECPPGKRVLGGGANVTGDYASVALDLSGPESNTSWSAAAHEHAVAGPWGLQVYAICGNAS